MIIKEVVFSLRFNFLPYGYLLPAFRQAPMISDSRYIKELLYCLLITFPSDYALAISDIKLWKTREEDKNIKAL